MVARNNHDLAGSPNDANAQNADMEHNLQEYAQHMAVMQQIAAQQISMFEGQSLRMKYDIDRMKFEMDGLRHQRSARSVAGCDRSEAMGGDLGRDDFQSIGRNLAPTPVVTRPHESDRHLWGSLQQNREARDALHRNMPGSKALVASGGAGGDARGGGANRKKGACRRWTSKWSCPSGSYCPFTHDPDARAPKGNGKGKNTHVIFQGPLSFPGCRCFRRH